MDAAAGLGDLGGFHGGHFEAAGAELVDQDRGGCGGNHLVIAKRHHVATKRHRIGEGDVDDLMPLGAQPLDNRGFGAGQADGGELFSHGHDHQVDMHVIFVDIGDPRFPTFGVKPTGHLFRTGLIGARLTAADQHAAFFDHVEIAALERASGHHVIDRDAELFIGADRGIVLPPTPPLRHGGDEGPVRRHAGTVAGIDLHGQFWLGLEHMDVDVEVFVGIHQFGMLRLRQLDVARRLAQDVYAKGSTLRDGKDARETPEGRRSADRFRCETPIATAVLSRLSDYGVAG